MKPGNIRYLVKEGFRSLWVNRIMAFTSFCVMMVSILLVGIFILLAMNINLIIGGVENKNEVIIFLEESVTEEGIKLFGDELASLDNVSEVVFFSKEEALEQQKEQLGASAELLDVLGDDNPLPDSYRIRVKDIDMMNMTVSTISLKYGEMIDTIDSPTDFVNILSGVKTTVTVVCSAVILALLVVSVVIISNATKSSVYARRTEIHIMKYVGATNTFIKVPFFVEGTLTGLLAGAAAAGLTWFGYDSLFEILSEEMTFWNALGIKEFIAFDSIAVKVFIIYCAAGALMGSLGTVMSTRKHLRV